MFGVFSLRLCCFVGDILCYCAFVLVGFVVVCFCLWVYRFTMLDFFSLLFWFVLLVMSGWLYLCYVCEVVRCWGVFGWCLGFAGLSFARGNVFSLLDYCFVFVLEVFAICRFAFSVDLWVW